MVKLGSVHNGSFEDCLSKDNDPTKYCDDAKKICDVVGQRAFHGCYKNTLDLCFKYFKKGDRILDVGAGSGAMGELLKDHGFANLHALDFSVNMLAEARKKDIYKDYIVELVDSCISSRVADNTFDGIVSVNMIGPGLLNPDHLSALIRMVRKEGVIVIGMRHRWLAPCKVDGHIEWPYNITRRLKEMEELNQLKVLALLEKHDPQDPLQDGAYLALAVL